MKVRAELRIHGRVQGVFFRQSTLEAATRLGLAGWVKNLPDGSVAVVAEGPNEAVRDLLDWCRQGPPAAEVKTIDVDWSDATGEFERFRIR
jgi:acylphosphatase